MHAEGMLDSIIPTVPKLKLIQGATKRRFHCTCMYLYKLDNEAKGCRIHYADTCMSPMLYFIHILHIKFVLPQTQHQMRDGTQCRQLEEDVPVGI